MFLDTIDETNAADADFHFVMRCLVTPLTLTALLKIQIPSILLTLVEAMSNKEASWMLFPESLVKTIFVLKDCKYVVSDG